MQRVHHIQNPIKLRIGKRDSRCNIPLAGMAGIEEVLVKVIENMVHGIIHGREITQVTIRGRSAAVVAAQDYPSRITKTPIHRDK